MKKFAKKRTTKRTRVVRKRAPKKSLAMMVRKEITKMAEHKTNQFSTAYSILPYNGTSWSTSNLFPVSPYSGFIAIAQGLGEGDRVGDRIRTVKAFLNVVMYPLPYNVTTNPSPIPQEVMLIIFGVKQNDILPTSLSGLFQTGNTSTAPVGSLVDLTRPFNKDVYQIYHRKIYKLGYAAAVGTGNVAGQQQYANNDYKYNVIKKIDITKSLPKIISYNDTTGIPFSKGVWCATMTVNADGSSQATTSVPVQMVYTIDYVYTDI